MTNEYDYDFEDALSTEQVAAGERETPCRFTTGVAGTGKTYNAVAAVAADPSHGVLSSTTGISAVNLGAITINSLLKYSDTAVMRDHFISGSLCRVLHALALRHRWIYLDEVSMFGGDALDILHRAIAEVNRYTDVVTPMGIHLLGDLAQLSPVKAPWVFTAGCWERFQENTETLTKVWRQDGGKFLDALNQIRKGDGAGGAALLKEAGARFETQLDTEFEGTTILSRNDQVSRYNQLALDRLPGKAFQVSSRRWGAQRSEWGQSVRTREWGIPPTLELKRDAYVMILANHPEFEWVNGDCGWVRSHGAGGVVVELVRTGKEIELITIIRGVEHSLRPAGTPAEVHRVKPADDTGDWLPQPHYRGRVKRWVTGQVEYLPLRLAYASTVHKSQSLTLDRVQVDYRNSFFKQPGMLYTALSRCRGIEGLRLIGQANVLVESCNVDERVRKWL